MTKHAQRVSKGHFGLRGRFYNPTNAPDEETKNRELVFSSVFIGTFCVTAVLCTLLFISYAILNNAYVLPRLLWCAGGVVTLIAIAVIYLRFRVYVLSAHILVAYYFVVAGSMIWIWGINTPFGILLLGLVIILAGILIRANYALRAAVTVTAFLCLAQIAATQGWHVPNDTWSTNDSNFGDVLGYCVGFGIIAVVSSLYGTQMERSLEKAAQAEEALEAEKASLEIKVAQRTAALEQTRLEELEHAYKFAELGSLSTALLHDLANYLTVLTMDIQDLQGKHNSSTIDRAHQTIQYIDKMVEDVRDQLNGTATDRTFKVGERISEIVGILRHKAQQAGVPLVWEGPDTQTSTLRIHGDQTRFSQMIAILVTNAIDACQNHKNARVTVQLQETESTILISVSDTGKALTDEQRQQLFKPFRSTKKQGMGIGLFLARQMAERHFDGTLGLESATTDTTFCIKLPKKPL